METRRQDELAKAWNEAVYLHIQRQIDERNAAPPSGSQGR